MTPAHRAGRRAGLGGTRHPRRRLFLATVGRSTTGRFARLISRSANLRKSFSSDGPDRHLSTRLPGDGRMAWRPGGRMDLDRSPRPGRVVCQFWLRPPEHAHWNPRGCAPSRRQPGRHDRRPPAGCFCRSHLPLDVFVGPAQVVEVGEGASSIRPDDIDQLDGCGAERVLFKTPGRASAYHEWPDAVVPIHPDTIHALSDAGTKLVGTDAPSVDPLDSRDLPAHHALIDTGIVNLEGLALANVQPGRYELVALPLKIADGDAAPVRAVLRDAPVS